MDAAPLHIICLPIYLSDYLSHGLVERSLLHVSHSLTYTCADVHVMLVGRCMAVVCQLLYIIACQLSECGPLNLFFIDMAGHGIHAKQPVHPDLMLPNVEMYRSLRYNQ